VVHLRLGEFWLEDKHSKFGTLLRAKASLEVPNSSSIQLQVQRSLLTFAFDRAAPCCLVALAARLCGRKHRGRVISLVAPTVLDPEIREEQQEAPEADSAVGMVEASEDQLSRP